jgi:hypothetical protein
MSANTSVNLQASTQSRILALLNSLPPESLSVVEQFVRFLQEQSRQGRPVAIVSEQKGQFSYHYPTISLAPSSLDRWLNLVPEGYEGDALADTEALYDEA